MLSKEELTDIDKEIKKFPHPKNACLDALMAVQKHRNYISDETLKDVAVYLGMSATELDGIATFYNLIYRKPVGACVIRLCDSVSCWIMGYPDVKKRISEKLSIDWGESTADKKYTLLPAQCLGTCDRAPAMMINDKLYRNLTPDRVEAILNSYDKEGDNNDSTPHQSHARVDAAP